jgi:pentatricopeptide repeat protein
MSSYHICTACRRRLAQVRPFRAPQWTPRATFISLSDNKPRTTIDEKASEEGPTPRKDTGANAAEGKGNLNLFTKRPPPKAADNPGDLLESLFQQTLTPPPPPSADADTPQSTFSLDNYQHAETLKKMLAEPNGVGDSWYFFIAHFGPEVWSRSSAESRSIPSYLHMSARNLIRQIIPAKARDPFSKTLPTVSEVSWIYAKLELLHGSDWAEMVLILIENILKLKQQSVIDPAKEKRLLVDLLGAWNVVCRKSGPPPLCPPPEDPIPLDWFNVPYFSSQDVLQTQRKLGALLSFAMLTPSFRTQHLVSVPLVATATAILLQQNLEQNNENTIPSMEHLFNALSTFLKSSGYDVSQLWGSAQGPHVEAVLNFVVKKWPARDEKSESEETVPKATLPPAPEAPQHDPSVSRLRVGDIFRRLETAIAQRDAAHVDRLWSDAMKLPVSHDSNEDGSSNLTADQRVGTLSAALCNHFIMANMGLRKPNRAIDVWNHMVSNGLTPNVKTWNAMLTGCKVARDRNALESIWKKMLMSGVKPDVPCWTTRISGLIECNLVNQGLQALNEMGRMWLAANPQKKTKKGQEIPASLKDAVKPTIETVNAAVSALLRKRKEEAAHRVLSWAGKLGLRPDTATFNILLRPLIREGRVEEVNSLLKQMQNTGIQADTVTFTIILDETLRTIGDETPEGQIEIVNSVFSEMEKAGIESSQHTYGKIIYQLLQTPTGDMTAVNAVLDQMSSQGVQVSTHIYTMLMEHYFASSPPNLDAVRSLIEAAQYKLGGTDMIFWDRVIEGYSRVGETAAAMRILGKLDGEENQSSYYTLRTLLMALVQNQEWEFARTLVENTRSERGGPISRLERGRDGQHQFWELAGELNLL